MLDRRRRLMLLPQVPILAERRFQPAIDFHRDVGLQADTLGEIVVAVVGSGRALLV